MKIRSSSNRSGSLVLFSVANITILVVTLLQKSIKISYLYLFIFSVFIWLYYCIIYFRYFKYIYIKVDSNQVYSCAAKREYKLKDFFHVKKIRNFVIKSIQLDNIKYYGFFQKRILEKYIESNNGYFQDTEILDKTPFKKIKRKTAMMLFIVTFDGQYEYIDLSDFLETKQFRLEKAMRKHTGMEPFRLEAQSEVDKKRKEYDMRNPKVWAEMAVTFLICSLLVAVGLLLGSLLMKLEIYLKPSHLVYDEHSRMRSIYYGTSVILTVLPAGFIVAYLLKDKQIKVIAKKGMLISGGIVIVAFLAATYLNW